MSRTLTEELKDESELGQRQALADAAALAPALFAYDLRTAEGLTQYLCNNR